MFPTSGSLNYPEDFINRIICGDCLKLIKLYSYSADLRRRLKEHNENGDWELIYYEAYRSEEDARKRERKLKDYGQSRTHLKRRLSNSLLK